MSAIWLLLRTEMRHRWRAWLGLALVFGIAFGAAIAAAAGARRTETAYPRFLRAQDSFHAVTAGGAEEGFVEHFRAIEKHPAVEDYVELVVVGSEITVPAKRGRPEQVLTLPEVVLITEPTGRGWYETNRAKVLEGRLSDRRSVGETTVPFTIAERYGIELGDKLVAGIGFDPERFPAPALRIPLGVVGIVAAPGDFEAVGQPSIFASLYVPPALYERYREIMPELGSDFSDFWSIGVHLRDGPRAAAAFKKSVEGDLNIDVPMTEPVIRSGVQKTMRLYAAGLWLLGGLIAIATLTIVGQTIARQQHIDSAEYPALRAIGASPRHLVGAAMVRAGLSGVVAAVVATIVAFLLSPLSPIGTARVAEPQPGFDLDVIAIGIGAAAALLLVPLLALVPSLRAARQASILAPSPGTIRPSRIVEGVARSSRSAVTVTGLRMALEPGRGRTAVPVRSTILAVAIGIAAVTGSVVVGRSLTHLIETPELAGFTYDAIVPNETDMPGEEMVARIRAFPFVERTTEGTGLNVVFEGVDSFMVAFEHGSPIGFATIDGRAPTDALDGGLPEIALGPATMRRLGLRLGNTVRFTYATEDESRAEATPDQPARVVGVAAIPALPWAAVEPGEGAVMTIGAIRRFSPNDEGGCCFVRFRPGTDLNVARAELQKVGLETYLRTKRSDLATLERISRLPALLSLIFGTIAAAALVHVLVTGIRRRRRDLAILKTIGFVKRQVRGAVAWQSSVIAILSVMLGIPVGLALGRWGWMLVAGQFGVVPAPVVPALFLGLLPLGAALLANLVAVIPGRIAAHTRPALVLRSE